MDEILVLTDSSYKMFYIYFRINSKTVTSKVREVSHRNTSPFSMLFGIDFLKDSLRTAQKRKKNDFLLVTGRKTVQVVLSKIFLMDWAQISYGTPQKGNGHQCNLDQVQFCSEQETN